MSLVVAILLAGACFAAIAFVFKVPRKAWTLVLTALVLGLAGYASQASPDLKGAPGKPPALQREEGAAVVDMRKDLVGPDQRSGNPLLVTADAYVRRGDYPVAGTLLRTIVHDNPNDAEAWLALGNALTFQADGMLTPASQLAYRRASELAPDSAGTAFFVGWSLIRQGKLLEGRQLWATRLQEMPEGAPGRDALARRLANLDDALRQLLEQAGKTGEK